MSHLHSTPSRRSLLAGGTALAGLGLGASLSGCSSSSKSAANSGGSDPKTIELWSRGAVGTGDAWKVFLPKLQEDTGITVKYSIIQNFDQELQSRAQSKNLPDIWVNDDALLGTYLRQGIAKPITQGDYDGVDAISDDLWAQTQDTDGTYYGIPFSRQTMANHYNTAWLKTLGAEAPTNWDELVAFWDACFAQDPDGNGSADTYGTNVAGTAANGYLARWAMSYIWQGGGSFWTKNDDGTFAVNTLDDATVDAVTWMQQLFGTEGRIQPGALTANTDASTPFFTEQKCGHTLIGPYKWQSMDNDLGKDNYVVAAAPAGPASATVLAEGENMYISAGTEKTDAVTAVVNWFISEEGQKAAMTNGLEPIVRVPVRSDMDAAEIYGDDRWKVVQDSLANDSEAFPAIADVAAIKSTVASSLNKILAAPTSDPRDELTSMGDALTDNFTKLDLL